MAFNYLATYLPYIAFMRRFSNELVGAMETGGYFTMTFCTTLIAFNRFIAIVFPTKMKTIFTWPKTFAMIAATWILGIGTLIVRIMPNGCGLIFLPVAWGWVPTWTSEQPWCDIIDQIWVYFPFCLIALLYIASFAKLLLHKKFQRRSVAPYEQQASSSGRISTREKRLFFQCAGIAAYFFGMDIIWTVVIIGGLFSKPVMAILWVLYAINTMIDGIIYFTFNKAFRKQFFINCGCSVPQAAETTASHLNATRDSPAK